MAFNSRKVEFCGKSRKFKRCANKELKDYQKDLEAIEKSLYPLTEKTRDSQFELKEIEDEIESINKKIELLERLEEPSDSEIRECMDLVSNKSKLQKKLHDKKRELDEIQLDDREFAEELDEKLRQCYGEFASKIFEDFTKTDFEEYADSTDLTIAPRLSELYRLATSGASQKDVDRAYQNIIKDSFRN